MIRRYLAAVLALLAAAPAAFAQTTPATDPALQPVLDKMAHYVASYGEKASLFVGIEKYTQNVTFAGQMAPAAPRRLVAEFAIVKAPGDIGWVGYRDVVEFDGDKVADRRDRLVSILTDMSADASMVTKLANESARYNIGPVSRNFNTPTSTLFFFYPANLSKFLFTKKDTKKIGGIETWEIAFKETASPTIVKTRSGKMVPLEGTLWVSPADGAILKSRLTMRNFADQYSQGGTQSNPAARAPVNPNTPTGGREALNMNAMGDVLDVQRIDTLADIEVTYARNEKFGIWLPDKMVEMYAGPISAQIGKPPVVGTATTKATYSDFKQFDTGVKINIPK
jgi:hypothetical protein